MVRNDRKGEKCVGWGGKIGDRGEWAGGRV